MRFGNMQIRNFMAIATAEVNLADRGLVGVQGENTDDTSADSNGAGKSSAFEALQWCLYGETAQGFGADEIVNRFSDGGKNCEVSVPIQDGSDNWIVTRYRKHKIHKNAVHLFKDESTLAGTVLKDCTQGTNDLTQKMILKLLGCPLDVFCASIYAGQGKMPELAGMTDKKLKMLVEEAAGTTVLESAYEEARQRLNALKVDRDALSRRVDNCCDLINSVDAEVLDLKRQEANWQASNSARVNAVTAQARDYVAQSHKIAADIDTLDLPKVRGRMMQLDAMIAAVGGERAQERTFNLALSKAQGDLRVAQTELRQSRDALDKANKAVAEVDHKIGCPCDECDRPLTAAEIAPTKKIAEDRAKIALKRATDATRAEETAHDALTAFQKALDDHRASMTDIGAVTAERASLEVSERVWQKLTSERAVLISNARAKADEAKRAAADPNPITTMVTKAQVKRQNLADELVKLEALLDEQNIGVEVAESVVKVFSPAGVRAHILDTVTPFLNDQTARYLAVLSDGNISATWATLVPNAKGELKEKFSIEVVNTLGGEKFGLTSGGEKRKVSIAAALALQDLVATRATKPLDLFIADEIDTALDPAGVERLMIVLEEKARERGSVFVISHSDLKNWIRQVLVVTKKGKMSTISEIET